MRVLVACEMSGRVRDAFAQRGHDALSADVKPSMAPGRHYQGDVRNVLMSPEKFFDGPIDLMIAHPPCTHLATSGANRWAEKQADGRQAAALDFVRELLMADIPSIALENPRSIISTAIRRPEQIIQPWMFGHMEQKLTCLWLKNLPRLVPTDDVKAQMMALPRMQRQRIGHMGQQRNRRMLRSLTFPGIAAAMATQWG